MTTYVRSSRWSQITAWIAASLFVLGFFIPMIGQFTGVILGVWFVGTQRIGRGLVWMMAITLLFSLSSLWHSFAHMVIGHGAGRIPIFLGTALMALLINVLPYTVHRIVSPRLPGFAATLPFPLASVAIIFLATAVPVGIATFLICWFGSTLVWMWNLEFRAARIAAGATVFTSGCALAAGAWIAWHYQAIAWNHGALAKGAGWSCVAGLLVLGVWALLRPREIQTWAGRAETINTLQSPFTREPLHFEADSGHDFLVSSWGEKFPIRNAIPVFLGPEDLTGDNGKYNHVYETIGGFYDDIQRVFCGLKGFDRHAHFRSYMERLEVKPGDAVLETSVGTGLNFTYLPTGVKLSGLDLSPEMLANCERNLRKWGRKADLYLGNAETLPFADSSFDVVFHVGGINFFNDRAKAIREMVRVARAGSLLLIADETEKHVKAVYEKQPGGLYKNRKEPVRAPVDLLPEGMEDIRLVELRGGDTYALTFRKPRRDEDDRTSAAAGARAIIRDSPGLKSEKEGAGSGA